MTIKRRLGAKKALVPSKYFENIYYKKLSIAQSLKFSGLLKNKDEVDPDEMIESVFDVFHTCVMNGHGEGMLRCDFDQLDDEDFELIMEEITAETNKKKKRKTPPKATGSKTQKESSN